jgi:hypothetical protein
MLAVRRRLAEKKLPREWDVLLVEQTTQTAVAPALELHRALVGASGEYRVGPVLPDFESLWAELVSKNSQPELIRMNNRIDKFVRDEALALFLCAP